MDGAGSKPRRQLVIVARNQLRAGAKAFPKRRIEQQAPIRIEPARWLVEQEQSGLVRRGAGQRESLQHAAREAVDVLVRAIAQTNMVEEGRDVEVPRSLETSMQLEIFARS